MGLPQIYKFPIQRIPLRGAPSRRYIVEVEQLLKDIEKPVGLVLLDLDNLPSARGLDRMRREVANLSYWSYCIHVVRKLRRQVSDHFVNLLGEVLGLRPALGSQDALKASSSKRSGCLTAP